MRVVTVSGPYQRFRACVDQRTLAPRLIQLLGWSAGTVYVYEIEPLPPANATTSE